MIKAGTSPDPPLRRPFSVMTRRPERGELHDLLEGGGRGQPRPGRPARGRHRELPGSAGPAVHASARRHGGAAGRGRLRHRALRDLLRRASTARGARRGSSTVAARWPTCSSRSAFAERGVPLVAATEDGSFGHPGRVTEPLEALPRGGGPRAATLYACGPDAMLHAVARLAARRGTPRAGQPRSLDGLRHRHLPRAAWCPSSARTTPGPVTVARAPRAPSSTPSPWSGPARTRPWPGGAPWRRPRREPGRGRGGAAPQEPAARGLRHLRLRRRVRGSPGPLAPGRPGHQGPVPGAARRMPDAAHRGDALGAAQRHRPAGRGRARLREGRPPPPRPLRHRGGGERVRGHRGGVRRGDPHRGRRAGGGRRWRSTSPARTSRWGAWPSAAIRR